MFSPATRGRGLFMPGPPAGGPCARIASPRLRPGWPSFPPQFIAGLFLQLAPLAPLLILHSQFQIPNFCRPSCLGVFVVNPTSPQASLPPTTHPPSEAHRVLSPRPIPLLRPGTPHLTQELRIWIFSNLSQHSLERAEIFPLQYLRDSLNTLLGPLLGLFHA